MAYTVHNFESGDVLYAEQLNEMDAQIAANEESIENSVSSDMLAESYSANKIYSIGDYVIYNNELYTCIYEITAPEGWNQAHWQIANLGDEISNLKNAIDTIDAGDVSYDSSATYQNGSVGAELSNQKNVLNADEQFFVKKITSYGDLEVGTFISTGALSSGSSVANWRRTTPLKVIAGSVVTVNNYGYRVRIGEWNDSNANSATTKLDYLQVTANNQYTYTVTRDCYIRISFETDGTNIPTTLPSQINVKLYSASAFTVAQKAYYVSTTGNDENDGSLSSPLATLNGAVLKGANTIIVMPGEYTQQLDLNLVVHDNIRIIAQGTQKVVFRAPKSLLATSAESVSGYTKVLSASCNRSFSTGNLWIWQEGVADPATEISSNERHPLQKGKQYRCDDTKIVRCTNTSLENALAEIEAADGYKWFYDSTNQVIYFSCPDTVSESKPIYASFNDGFLYNYDATKPKKIELCGLVIKYMFVFVGFSRDSVVSDCVCKNVYSNGAFRFNSALNAQFIRCEASQCCASATTGDGFNAEASSGEEYTKEETATLIDCWSHDNVDDGVSTHAYSELTILGGLYEYNIHGGGVTPASGCHATCYDVIARKNGEAGFLYTGQTSEGNGGQIACYNCVSSDNTDPFDSTDDVSCGYKVESDGNSGLFIGCKAIGENIGFYTSGTNTTAECVDCSTLNCTTGKSGSVTSENTVPLQ